MRRIKRAENNGPWFDKTEIESTVPARFRRVASKYPHRIAISSKSSSITYKELDLASERIAGEIVRQLGHRSEPIVLLMDQSATSLTTILGVLKSGKFYVVLEPTGAETPSIIRDTQTRLILADHSNYGRVRKFADSGIKIIEIESLKSGEGLEVKPNMGPDSAAALFYTSGSTGQRKGVVCNHRMLLHFAWRKTVDYNVQVEDRQSLLASAGFSAAVTDIYLALLNGASLSLADTRELNYEQLARWIDEKGITLLHPTIALFRHFADSLDQDAKFTKVRMLTLGGDAINHRDVERYKNHFSENCALWHSLASTEAGIYSNVVVDHNTEVDKAWIPRSTLVDDADIVLIGENGQPVQTGDIGEITVRSRYLSSGYWQNDELTGSKYLQDKKEDSVRTFFTGDLGRIRRDGRLEFLGRRDSQVKVRGFRIVLGEIEKELIGLENIVEACVIKRMDRSGDDYLVAYIVPLSRPGISVEIIRRKLLKKIPDYMVPTVFVALEAIPRTSSGKVDHRVLPEPERKRPELESIMEAPRNELEKELTKIWEDIMDIRPIGVRDNFFDLGGHSLTAFRLFSRIHKEFGATLPITTLLDSPTIENIAEEISKSTTSSDWSYLVGLNTSGSKPPLFIVPPAAITVLKYSGLTDYLGADQPLYGLQPKGFFGDSREPHNRVEEMAADYISEIRLIQPVGPYYLLGQCFGGIVAFEMATQLLSMGQAVGMLAILDTLTPPGHGPHSRKDGLTRRIKSMDIRGLVKLTRNFLKQTPVRKREKLQLLLIGLGIPLRLVAKPEELSAVRVKNAHFAARAAYKPKVYPGRITYFWTRDTDAEKTRLRPLWAKMSSVGLDVHYFAGNHRNMMEGENIGFFAKELHSTLVDAQMKALESVREQ